MTTTSETTFAQQAEDLARALHADPEVSLEEFRSSERCQELLRSWGFAVEVGTAGLPTAFLARLPLGSGAGPRVALLAEFDALPAVGHACGHNLIAGGVLEAAARLMADPPGDGELLVLGTPGEELFAGKGPILRAGALEGVDAVVTYHPHDGEGVFGHMNGVAIMDLTFHGRASHAAGRPYDGRSAQDGVTLATHAFALERQYHRDGCRIHALVGDHDGSHNVFPSTARLRVNVRAPELDQLERLVERVREIAAGAAQATATTVDVVLAQHAKPYVIHQGLAELAWDVMAVPHGSARNITGSSDLGDITHELPTVTVTTVGWDPATWHSKELHDAAGTPRAYDSMHRAADHMVAIASRIFRGDPSWRK